MTQTTELAPKARKAHAPERHAYFARPRWYYVAFALVYLGCAVPAAWNIIHHTEASTKAIEEILVTYNMKNEGSMAVERYGHEHPFLGFFFSGMVRHQLDLPSKDHAEEQLTAGVREKIEAVRYQANLAAWWSWGLLTLSALYIITVIALERRFTTRAVLFTLTSVSLFCFIIGVLAPAMIIWTAPQVPIGSAGDLAFVLQHQVRGIWAIIWELLTNGHWIIGGFLFLFSIVTPMTKATLTFAAAALRSRKIDQRIGTFLHAIGKWSMADVFVAAVLLALYALKYQQATKSIPCLGLYYFIGYCLLSMTTTELLVQSEIAGGHRRSSRQLGLRLIAGLFVAFFCIASASGVFTYEQYTVFERQPVHVPESPEKLNNANLVLPAHQKAP